MTDELEALARRCEEASAPDRVIDGLIYAHKTRGEPYLIGEKPGRFPREPIYGERADVMRELPTKDGADYIGSPAYTASLDTAMTLVPEGWGWTVRDTGSAQVLHPTKRALDCGGNASTPALALCSAALRAIGKVEE